jgi:DUF3048 family protein
MRRITIGLVALIVLVGAAIGIATFAFASVHGSLQLTHPGAVRLSDPVTVSFAQGTNTSNARVKLSPDTPVTIDRSNGRVVVSPRSAWLPDRTYDLEVDNIPNLIHTSSMSSSGSFQTSSGLEPSNTTSGIGANFTTKTPLEIVIENSGPARPQTGFQQADMVYEYISEYSISRMTAIYFNQVPAIIGPVRSCRLINIPLNQAYFAVTMCSGVSPGTHGVINQTTGPRPLHLVINDYDHGGHFFRDSSRVAPYNLFTDAARAARARSEAQLTTPAYTVDSPHSDSGLGVPAAAPSVPLQDVTYAYNQGSQTYARLDHGAPFIDNGTHAQLQVKTVVMLHVDWHLMPYIEDENGGAHSAYYQMVGSGPAQIYSDGKLINATWHMSALTPIYFTDAQGNFIRLNSGLTWIHVLGNGQTS